MSYVSQLNDIRFTRDSLHRYQTGTMNRDLYVRSYFFDSSKKNFVPLFSTPNYSTTVVTLRWFCAFGCFKSNRIGSRSFAIGSTKIDD